MAIILEIFLEIFFSVLAVIGLGALIRIFVDLINNKKEKNKEAEQVGLPHELCPEILLWKRGDKTKYGELAGIGNDGTIFFKNSNYYAGGMGKTNIKNIVEDFGVHFSYFNISSEQRKLQEELDNQGTDYIQYIQDFKKAYKEIKGGNNDKKTDLLNLGS